MKALNEQNISPNTLMQGIMNEVVYVIHRLKPNEFNKSSRDRNKALLFLFKLEFDIIYLGVITIVFQNFEIEKLKIFRKLKKICF